MTNYKLLEYGHFYINREGDFAVGLLSRDSKYDYRFLASHAHPAFVSGIVRMVDRVVPDDGSWIEIDIETFKAASILHGSGSVLKFSAGNTGGELPVVFKKY